MTGTISGLRPGGFGFIASDAEDDRPRSREPRRIRDDDRGRPMDMAKHDMTLGYGGRTFAVRAYLDGDGPGGPGWRAVVVENRTPLHHGQGPSPDAAGCFAEAVRFVAGLVVAQAGVSQART
jgi:hypothetical protein